jgi:hypothetical protein
LLLVIVHILDNFDKYSIETEIVFNNDYDYYSVMHYEPTAFGKEGKITIIPKVKGVKIGQREGFSHIDIYTINKYYDCVPKPFEWANTYMSFYGHPKHKG